VRPAGARRPEAGGAGAILLAALGLLGAGVSGCSPACQQRALRELPAPGGGLRAVAFERRCGEHSTIEVSLLPSASELRDAPGNVLTADADTAPAPGILLEWRESDRLLIHHGPSLRIRRSVSALGPVRIELDTGFAAMQARGAQAMGVDQYTSSHVFEDLPDGGRIVLQRDSVDSAGTAAIRRHMETIAAAFRNGDFRIPGFVHAGTVPGTEVMTARRSRITYQTDTVPRGGEVRILTRDSLAVEAIHDFLAYQRSEHHAAGHMMHEHPAP
jgi:hypothetical protein